MDDIRLDFGREARMGLPETIFCAQKSIDQIERIAQQLLDHGGSALFTRLEVSKYDALQASTRSHLDFDSVSSTAFLAKPSIVVEGLENQRANHICVVAAGTSDLPVAKEAVRTLQFHDQAVTEIYDVGVAGIWRLMERVDEIKAHPIVIAVAGMDAALVSVLGGMVAGSIIAVPTSTGYGMAGQGESALRSALVSCAPGVAVTNIDNGYGGACAALRVIRSWRMFADEQNKGTTDGDQ